MPTAGAGNVILDSKVARERSEEIPITNAQELFVHELGEIYDAEHRFIVGQQEMAEHATDGELKEAIQEHLEQTERHAANVERVFTELGREAQRETNEAARGLVSEAQEGIQQAQSEVLRDAAIVSAVIEVEHFEMGSYRGLVTGANLMGQTEIERLLRENMDQEEQTATIAEQSAEELLRKAIHEGGEQQQERAHGQGQAHGPVASPTISSRGKSTERSAGCPISR